MTEPKPESCDWSGALAVLDAPTPDGRMLLASGFRLNGGGMPVLAKSTDPDRMPPLVGYIDRVWVDGNVLRAKGSLVPDLLPEDTWAGLQRGQVPIGVVVFDATTIQVGDQVHFTEWRVREAMLGTRSIYPTACISLDQEEQAP